MIDREDDRDEIAADSYASADAYFQMMADEEQRDLERAARAKVVPIRPEVVAQHTDDELVPLSPGEAMLERLVFDPEAALLAAAHETWLLDDLVPTKGVGFIYGPPGSYKSFIALDMALSVTTGRPWHGYECEAPGAVVYIAAEGSRGLLERAVAWKRHYGVELGPLMVMPMPIQVGELIEAQAFIECMQKAQEQLGQPIRLMVIDTMARSFSGDENSAQEVGAFINSAERIATEIGECFLMVVTHTGKDTGRGIRGSSALDGASYASFLVTKPNDGQALVKNVKQKDIEKAEPMRFAMELVSTGIPDRKGRIRKSLVPILESKGADADPDAEDDDLSAFESKDIKALVGMVRAAELSGKPVGEDELRNEFRTYLNSEGKSDATAKKTWQRVYKRARDEGLIMKAGANLHVNEVRK